MADIGILAEDTSQIAGSEKNSAAALPTAKAILFAEMREITRNAGVTSDAADLDFLDEPVNAALPWANPTVFQRSEGAIDAPVQLAGFLQVNVTGEEKIGMSEL